MKFIALDGAALDAGLLEQDYRGAYQVGNVRLGESTFYFKGWGGVYFIPFTGITRCFRRVELVPARMCCGRGNLEIENLVIVGQDEQELAQISLPGARAGQALLEMLKQRLPHAAFGKKPAAEEPQ